MHHALPPKRSRLAPKRIAAATAAALGAALLTYPGAATAQDTGIDCAALGENPMADGMEAALETAVACDTEVRIAAVSGPYETVYATPQGQLHLVQTVDPTQDYQDQGLADPTLVEAGGTLVPADSPIEFTFSGTDTTAPLMRTQVGNLDWNGDQPVPAVSGGTAVYEGLTEGLDLTIDAGISSSDLQFTIADAEAWQAVATKLTATASVDENSLYAAHPRENPGDLATWEQSTPFTIRDADGAAHSVTLTDGAGTSFSLALDQAVLDAAVYPLTLTTTWTYHLVGVSEWGAVTSASPDLALFRGEAGLDRPYFEAAGQASDAVVGGYCDALADPECATVAQTVLYWNFWRSKVFTVGPSSMFGFSSTAATFSVEAADGAECTAPDLQASNIYRPSTRWSNRPALRSTPTFSGHCENGTAVYDLSGSAFSAGSLLNTLVMADSAETALLKGGSARLDAYFDIRAYSVRTNCKTSASDPARRSSSTVPYGGFTADLWRPDLVDQDLTWTATVKNVATEEIVASSAPAELESGAVATSSVEVEDGLYSVQHSVNGLVQSNLTCYHLVDTQRPEFVDITVPPGPHFVGDIVPVEVTVADAGFPNGFSKLTIFCLGADDCEPEEVVLTDKTTVTFELEITKSGTTPWLLQMYDEARYVTYSEEIHIAASYNRWDYNGDDHQDLFAVRKSDGQLMFHAGKGDGSFASGAPLGSGWGALDIVMAGDLTSDGTPDLLARDTKSGNLYTYPGDGSGGIGARITAGSGWNGLGVFTSNGDFNGDGKTDLYAVGRTDGKLYFYPGKGNGTFGARTAVGTGWGVMDTISTFADFNLDGRPDLLADDHLEGEYFVYYGQGDGKVGSPVRISDSFEQGSLSTAQYNEIVAAGDYDENGTKEVVSIDALTGNLVTHSFDELGNPVYPPKVVDDGWGGYSLPGTTVDRTYDYNGSATTDLVARHGSTGTVYVYTGNGSGGFGPRIGWGTSMANMNLLETAGDFTGDGIPDLLARVASTGSLYVMPGTGYGDFDYAGRIRTGTGWNSMSAIVSGQDFNGDGKVDILAREKSTGYLWLYPGKGDGHVGTRVQIGSGWNAMREITAVGDLNHDGHADVLAIRGSDNCMYFYGGRSNGTLKPGVQIGCNWVGYDSVAAVGDFNSDGHADWVARRKSDGALYLYKGNGVGGYSSRAQIGTGWNSMNIIA